MRLDWNRRLECRRVGDIWGRECWSWSVSPLALGRRADGSSSWSLLRVVHELQLAGHRFIFTVNEARWPTVRAVPFELVTRSKRLSAHNPKRMTTGSKGVPVVMIWWGGGSPGPVGREVTWTRVLHLGRRTSKNLVTALYGLTFYWSIYSQL